MLDLVQQARVDPVTGMHDDVRVVDGGPHLGRQVTGALRHMGIRQQEESHGCLVPSLTRNKPMS